MPIEMPGGLPFAVDTWGPSSRRRRHCFLTHAHRDHLVGAGGGVDGGGTIYATRLTLSLALRHFPQLGSWEFVEMEVGKTVVVDDPSSAFSVTAYDANHCPGAVMFLFEGEFGSILHTGDCRLTPDCVQNLPLKYIAKKGKENVCRLAFVFLDCTFSKCFLKLPSKESAIQQVITCIWKHPHAPFVYLACDLLGHEDILIKVSRTFGLKIYVDQKLDCFKVLSLTAPEIITNDPSSRFQMVGFHQLYDNASKKLEEARSSLQPEPLFIRPSTQWYANYTRNQKPCLTEAEQDEFGVWHICFSIHSSRDELEQALQLLEPQWVISTTPPCFAIELSYVRKHCFKTRITADDPLWKIFRDPLGKSVSSPSSVLDLETRTEEDHSNFLDDNEHSSPANEECTYLNALELNVVSSLPPEEPDITLFGRARFASQAIDIMKEELCNQYLAFEDARACAPTDLVRGSSEEVEIYSAMDMVAKQVPSSLQEHAGAGEEVHLCQREQSQVLSEVIQVQSLPAFEDDTLGVADQLEKAEAACESKPSRSAMYMVMKQVPSCRQEHAGAGEEIHFCQREPSPVLSEVFQVQSLNAVEDDKLGVADQRAKSEAASELKPLRSAEGSSVSVVRSAEKTDCQKEPLCFIGSSKCLNASLKRLYRSRNIPVPRPLPSLVRLFESSKRVKIQQNTNSGLLNSQHSFP